MGFQTYMDEVRSMLKCNRPDPKQFSFDYNIEQIDQEKLHFFQSFRGGLSSYEALMHFNGHLENKRQCQK